MLTKSDLQAIAKFITDEGKQIRNEFNARFGTLDSRFDKVDSRLGTLDSRLDKVDSRLGTLDSRLDKVENQLKPIKNDIRKMKKDISIMVSSFNREDVHLKRRVDRIENRLGLPPME